MIAICLPTRGIIDTRTIEAIISNVEGLDVKFYFTDKLPLPDSRINVTDRALSDGCDYLWWVDDDMVPPTDWLKRALSLNRDIVTSPYYMQNGKTSIYYEDGVPKQCGFGCCLIRADVYRNTPKPWYNTNKVQIKFGGGRITKWIDQPNRTWGGEDIWFYHQAVELAGYEITVLDQIVPHLRIDTWGNKYLNNGVHDIYELGEEGQRNFSCPEYDPKEFIDGAIKNMEGQS